MSALQNGIKDKYSGDRRRRPDCHRKGQVPDPGNVKLSLEYIRRTAGYASDIAEIALKETIDEVTEKHSATSRRQ